MVVGDIFILINECKMITQKSTQKHIGKRHSSQQTYFINDESFLLFRSKFGSLYKNKKKIIIVSYRIEDTKFYTHNNTFFVDSQKAKPSDVYQINQIENILFWSFIHIEHTGTDTVFYMFYTETA